MKKITKNNQTASGSEGQYVNGLWITKHFNLYCDICGVKHPKVCVNSLCEEEGFPDGDYCWNCQMSMREQGFVGEDKSIYLLKKDYPKSNKEKLDLFLIFRSRILRGLKDPQLNWPRKIKRFFLSRNNEFYALCL